MDEKIKKNIVRVIIVGIVFLIFFLGKRVYLLIRYNYGNYYTYYDEDDSSNVDVSDYDNSTYETVIVHDNKYNNIELNSLDDAKKIIKDDSVKQKSRCPSNVIKKENDIMAYTGIHAVNLCEVDYESANKIYESIKWFYDNYPIIKDYVTNVTLVNDGGTSSYIAAFKPAFTFATSSDASKFPFVIKIQVFLNASYYLNGDYFDDVVENASSTNYFPKDTSRYSLIMHEFGHVLTYILAIKYNNSVNTIYLKQSDFKEYASTLSNYTSNDFSKMIIDEAINNYSSINGNISEEDFVSSISMYANTYTNNNTIMYNETVAEAIHDYYLHKDNANATSIYIVDVINKYIINYS